jgi:hypothetical protein
MDALFKLVPIGRTHEGVRYPVMENGVMTSMVTSERMTRLDENNLQFEDAIIDQRGNEPLRFYLERAVYSRVSELLLSNQPARIESATYHIESDSLSFDRKNNVARLDGRVRMTIFDLNAGQKKAPTEKSAAAEPAKPAPAVPTAPVAAPSK